MWGIARPAQRSEDRNGDTPPSARVRERGVSFAAREAEQKTRAQGGVRLGRARTAAGCKAAARQRGRDAPSNGQRRRRRAKRRTRRSRTCGGTECDRWWSQLSRARDRYRMAETRSGSVRAAYRARPEGRVKQINEQQLTSRSLR